MILLDTEGSRPQDKAKETEQPTVAKPSQKDIQLEQRAKVPQDIQQIYPLERHFYW